MWYDKLSLAGCLVVVALFACNSPMQNKEEQAAHDSANKHPVTPNTLESKSEKRDTSFGDYRIAVITKGNGYMRDLFLAIGSKKDTTVADSIVEKDVKGELRNVLIADLNGNGRPEVYCTMLSEGTGRYGKLYGFELQHPVIRIDVSAVDTMEQAAYRGQDSFYIKGKNLVRTYPAYREGASDALTANTQGIILYGLKQEHDTLKLLPVK
ncbi:MAG: hypothetical protein J7623_14850 [Chitinophaga sp.]|uniref:hypothetical protein n=1 Tax=Chitinophaga sp. TaxID=1869181 RepID=UPI001B27309E|nr:hypothetical protein [Chitinophaga sp.]MBO9729914.1 hypothetical protein [Chitinophaga sp.]